MEPALTELVNLLNIAAAPHTKCSPTFFLPSLEYCEDIEKNAPDDFILLYLGCKASDFGAFFVDSLTFQTRFQAALMMSFACLNYYRLYGEVTVGNITFVTTGAVHLTDPEDMFTREDCEGRHPGMLLPNILTLDEAQQVYKLAEDIIKHKMKELKFPLVPVPWCFDFVEDVTARVMAHVARFGHDIKGKRIEVFWDGDDAWYPGLVMDFDASRSLHTVLYDDGKYEDEDLPSEQVKIKLLSSFNLHTH